MRRTFEECKNTVTNYIRKNNDTTVDEIERELQVNVNRLFGGIKQAFGESNVIYPRKFVTSEDIHDIVDDIKNNPLLTVDDIQKKYHFNFYKKFKNIKTFCKKYGIKPLSGHEKRTIKKQLEVINYIKMHPNATQWKINKNCHTHVQEIFPNGIVEAFKKANVEYPAVRKKIYGTANKIIKYRAIRFEKSVFDKLEKLGILERYVVINGGVIDGILRIQNRKFIVEIKDYLSKPISSSEINQLVKYMKSVKCKNGILVCNKKGNKDKVQIGSYRISIITKDEIRGRSPTWLRHIG